MVRLDRRHRSWRRPDGAVRVGGLLHRTAHHLVPAVQLRLALHRPDHGQRRGSGVKVEVWPDHLARAKAVVKGNREQSLEQKILAGEIPSSSKELAAIEKRRENRLYVKVEKAPKEARLVETATAGDLRKVDNGVAQLSNKLAARLKTAMRRRLSKAEQLASEFWRESELEPHSVGELLRFREAMDGFEGGDRQLWKLPINVCSPDVVRPGLIGILWRRRSRG
jgi:hypothetical protein